MSQGRWNHRDQDHRDKSHHCRSHRIRRHLIPITILIAVCVTLAAPSISAREFVKSSSGDPDLCLPGSPTGGEIVHPYGIDVPAGCERFLERHGSDWIVIWDRELETPRRLVPASPVPLEAGEGLSKLDAALDAALTFVDDNAGFLGVGSRDLGNVEVLPFDDGYLLTSIQVHQGLPVRCTHFRMRLTADLSLRSVTSRVARDLPEVSSPALDGEDVEALAKEAGLGSEVEKALVLVFPSTIESAVPAWGVTASLPDDEAQVFYSALDGSELLAFSTALHADPQQDGPAETRIAISGFVGGRSPDPDDVFSLPARNSVVYPLEGARVKVLATGLDGQLVVETVELPADGEFLITLEDVRAFLGYQLAVFILPDGRPPTLEEYVATSGWFPPRTGFHNLTFNLGDDATREFQSLHLMTFHHLERGRKDILDQIRRHGLMEDPDSLPEPLLRIRRDGFGSSYLPGGRIMFLASDELEPREPDGRWRKVVPTVIHHEFGHLVFRSLTRGGRDLRVNEGVSDALAGYIARASLFGFAEEEDGSRKPNAGEASRDLARDVVAWRGTGDGPLHGRRVVAGALWELWNTTLNGDNDEGRPTEVSDFAFGLLARWLVSIRTPDPLGDTLVAGYTPVLGVDFLVEADDPAFRGNNDLRDGSPWDSVILPAFGRRNLFPHAFIRGDANGDRIVDLSDAITVLGHLFLGGDEVTCPDALDADDSGDLEVTDAIRLLNYLFLGGGPPPLPFPRCGWDLTAADGLGCWAAPCPYFTSG